MLRVVEHLVGEAGLDHAAALHHHHAVGQQAGHGEVVRDDDRGELHLAGELAHQVEKIGCPVLLITTQAGISDGELLTVLTVPKQANQIAQGILNIFAAQLFAAELSDAAGLTDTKFRYRMSDTKVPVAA